MQNASAAELLPSLDADRTRTAEVVARARLLRRRPPRTGSLAVDDLIISR